MEQLEIAEFHKEGFYWHTLHSFCSVVHEYGIDKVLKDMEGIEAKFQAKEQQDDL